MQEVSVKASQQSEDMELARRSQAGDTEAFDKLVTKYRTKIFIMVCGKVRNEHDAWDLAQEGFLKAWRSIHQFEGRSSFYTWLYRITVNLTIYSLRRNGRGEEVELNDAIPSSLPGPGVKYQPEPNDGIGEQNGIERINVRRSTAFYSNYYDIGN